MSCDAVREFLLEMDWDADGRRQAGEFLGHLDRCDACRNAVREFDRIHAVLAPVDAPEPAGGWDAMQRRMAGAISESQHRQHYGWLRAGVGLAAAVLVTLTAFEVGRQTIAQSAPLLAIDKPAPAEQAPAGISPGEVSHDIQAFRQVSDFYDGRAGWVLVSQNNSDMGVSSDPMPAAKKKVLLLRLDLWHGSDLVSNADLMVLAGQKADLTMPLPSGRSLHYRIGTSIDDPARLTVSLELETPQGGEPLAALATNLQMKPGQKLTAGKLATSAGEYELKIEFAGSELADAKP